MLVHLSDNNLLAPHFHSFLDGLMQQTFHVLWTGVRDGIISHEILVIFANAFEQVQHIYLLYKLEFSGISGRLALVRSFLTGLSFTIKPRSSISDSSLIRQGSVVGSLPFLI